MLDPIESLVRLGGNDISGKKPIVAYAYLWHLWTNDDGVSHQARCALMGLKLTTVQLHIDPQHAPCHVV